MSDHLIRPRLFATLGGAAIGLALIWWFSVFGTVVRNGYGSYGQASQCIWGQDYVCTLLLSLCPLDHPPTPSFYRPELFWAGAALVAGAVATGLRRRRA